METEQCTLEIAIKGSLGVFAKNYQYAINSVEQLRTDHAVMGFINNYTKDVTEQERYFNIYKEMRNR